jgi:hypothetical protein
MPLDLQKSLGASLFNRYIMIEELKLKKTSDTVFIIGGGSSLSKYLPDKTILEGKDIICTNNAYQLYPNAMILFFMDKVWFEKHDKTIKETFKGIPITCDSHLKKFFHDNGINYIFNRGPKNGLSENPDKLNGTNSGAMAINLAVLMGYKKIVLLGFDMNKDAKTLHWHPPHFRPSNTDRYATHFLPGMNSIAPFQEKFDFKIYNINKESAITCFEFAELEKFL